MEERPQLLDGVLQRSGLDHVVETGINRQPVDRLYQYLDGLVDRLGVLGPVLLWWRWNGISPDVEVEIVIVIGIPTVPMRFKSARRTDRAGELAERFGVELLSAAALYPESRESPAYVTGVVQGNDDSISVLLERVNVEAELASMDALRESASSVVSQLDPEGRLDLVLDRFTSTYHAGAGRDGDRVEPAVADITAHYRQRFEGVPAVMGGAGHVAITLDRSGRLCRIVDTTVEVGGEGVLVARREVMVSSGA